MNEIWIKYEQIVNKIILILFRRTYTEPRHIAVRYMIALLDYPKCKVFLLDKISYNSTCKNVQNTTYAIIHTVILYYYGMFSYWGIFTFSVTAVFSPGQGCVLLKRKPPNLNHRFHTNPINCVNFSHNSP